MRVDCIIRGRSQIPKRLLQTGLFTPTVGDFQTAVLRLAHEDATLATEYAAPNGTGDVMPILLNTSRPGSLCPCTGVGISAEEAAAAEPPVCTFNALGGPGGEGPRSLKRQRRIESVPAKCRPKPCGSNTCGAPNSDWEQSRCRHRENTAWHAANAEQEKAKDCEDENSECTAMIHAAHLQHRQ